MGNQSFFWLDDYKDEIYSMISPFVYSGGELTVNFYIEKQKSIIGLANAFIKAEFMANNVEKLIKCNDLDDINKLCHEYCLKGVNSSLVAEFSSPGRTSNKTTIDKLRIPIYLLCLGVFLNGGDIEIPFVKAKLNPFISEANQRIIVDHTANLIKGWLEENSRDIEEDLSLRKPIGRIADFEW